MAKTNSTTKKNKVTTPRAAVDAPATASENGNKPTAKPKTRAAAPAPLAPTPKAEPIPAPSPTKTKRVAQPKVAALPGTAPASQMPPPPPPPIPGVTKPAVKAKAATKPKAAPKLQRAGEAKRVAPAKKEGFTQDDVALRAYFIAQRRHAEGRAGNPETDWIEAENALRAEHGLKARS